MAKRAEAEIEQDGERFKVAKGAPQVIIDLCELEAPTQRKADRTRRSIATRAKGFRTLGVARTR